MNTRDINLLEISSLEIGKQQSSSKISINEIFEDKIGEFVEAHDIFKNLLHHTDLDRNRVKWYRQQTYSGVEIDYVPAFDIRIGYVFNTEEIEQRLLEIKQETEEICEIDNEVDMVHERAYSDIRSLLNIINKTNPRIPMPDLDSADDGSLNITWIHKDNIITMGVYGNNNVMFTLYFKEKRQVSGVCELSDKPVLNGFFQTLYDILHE